MAAATVTNQRSTVIGNLRKATADSIAFAANGDTWDTRLKTIRSLQLTPTTNTAFGFTVDAWVVTLVSGGALTFRGGVDGL